MALFGFDFMSETLELGTVTHCTTIFITLKTLLSKLLLHKCFSTEEDIGYHPDIPEAIFGDWIYLGRISIFRGTSYQEQDKNYLWFQL